MTLAQNANYTDTLGWDTVFAIPISQVNETIRNVKASPPKFAFSNAKGDTVLGDFADWQVTAGGDGSLIWLSIPVANVTGTLLFGNYAWSQGTLMIEVRLKYIPHDEPIAEQPTVRPHDLKLRTKSDNPADPVVSIKNIIWNTDPTGPAVDAEGTDVVKAIIPALIGDWLNTNLEQFAHIFATVNLNESIDQDAAWAWTKPTYIDYAYIDGPTLQSSILGVLCMTGGRSAGTEQIQQIDRYVIPVGSIAGYLVTQERLLADLMLPTLPLHWKNSSAQDYEVVQQGDTSTGKYQHLLRLKSDRTVQLDPVEHDGSTYTPSMKAMSIAVEGSEITFETYTETPVGMGVIAYCQTTHWYTMSLGTSKNGQTLVYAESRTPVIDHGTHESEKSEVEKWMIIVAGLLATAVLAVVTDGAALAVGGVIIGLLTGIAATSPEIICTVNSDASPSLDLLTFNSTTPIQWNSTSVFELDYAAINGPLQLGGNPHFG